MIKKTLVGLAIGCVLSTPAAFAEEYKGFYFGVWGGGGKVDMPSKADFDEAVLDVMPTELDRSAYIDTNNTSVTTDDVLHEFALAATGNSSLDDSVSVWGAQIGYRFGKYFATEVGYAHLGEASYRLPALITETATDFTTGAPLGSGDFAAERAVQFTSAGPTISALGMLPIGQVLDLHVRAGVYLADTRVTNRTRDVEFSTGNINHRRVDASQTEIFGGIGGAWNINESFTLRVEYQKYLDVGDDEKNGESDIDVFNLSVLFR